MKRHLTSLYDFTPEDVLAVLETAANLKRRFQGGDRAELLPRHVLTQLFSKPSLRTRNSFETAMVHLGGTGIFLTTTEAGLNDGGRNDVAAKERESLKDVATVISSYSDVITLRTYSQQLINEFASYSSCPVINALSDERHPCQALTDLLTIQELTGKLEGHHLVFIGDGNNVAMSLAIASAMTGMKFTVAVPDGFRMPEEFTNDLARRFPQAQISQTSDPRAAVASADFVYTDVWASMGQEEEEEKRKAAFREFQVNADLMRLAPKDAKFMHDMPAKRGLEVTDDVMDGPQCVAYQQAENRMHLARGLFAWLLAESD